MRRRLRFVIHILKDHFESRIWSILKDRNRIWYILKDLNRIW